MNLRSEDGGVILQRLGSITKQGSKIVRYLLGQAVVKVLRFDMAMRTWYKRIKKRRGSKIARVETMRRMATIIWQMIKNKRKYEYESPIKKHRDFRRCHSGNVTVLIRRECVRIPTAPSRLDVSP